MQTSGQIRISIRSDESSVYVQLGRLEDKELRRRRLHGFLKRITVPRNRVTVWVC